MIQGLLPGWPWGARAKSGTLALTLNDQAMRYVLASEAGERGATLVSWGVEARGNSTREAFMKRVKSALPMAAHTVAVLDSRDYQIMQLESPNVPAEELRGAVRWRAMEFLEGSPHDYTLDVLNVPAEGARAGHVIAVIAHNNVIRDRMLEAESLGHPLSVVDVVETSQRNLLHAVMLGEQAADNVVATLVADGGRALMVVAAKGQLQFFRRFEFDIDMLAVPVDGAESALIAASTEVETVSRSLTQLHRSLDLWEDTHPNLPLSSLRVHAGAKTDAIVDRLRSETGLETKAFSLASIFKAPPSKAVPPWLDTAYLPLLGALLRPAS